jgi:hypothetical protein
MATSAKPELRLLWYSACAAAARDIAAEAFDTTVDMLLSPQRGKLHVATARQVAMYMTHTICSVPHIYIARSFRRDRTTVSYACGRVEDMRDDAYFDRQLEVLEHKLVDQMKVLEREQLREQQAVIEKTKRLVVGGEDEGDILITSENGRLLEFKPFKLL